MVSAIYTEGRDKLNATHELALELSGSQTRRQSEVIMLCVMKNTFGFIVGIALALTTTSVAFAAVKSLPPIACSDAHGHRLLLNPRVCKLAGGKSELCYDVELDEALSSSRVGAMGAEGYAMVVTPNPKLSKKLGRDVLDEWDGSVGVTVILPLGTLSGAISAGKEFAATVKVEYSDIDHDKVKSAVTCESTP